MRTLLETLSTPDASQMSQEERLRILEAQAKDRADLRAEIERRSSGFRGIVERSDTGALSMAQGTIRTSMLLNGGGLVAIPAIVTLLGLDARSIQPQILQTALLFVAGLVLAWFAGFAAFIALSNRHDAGVQMVDWVQSGVFQDAYGDPTDQKAMAAVEALRNAGNRDWKKFERWRIAGVTACALAVGFFVAGGYVGGKAALEAPTRPAATSSQR